MADRLSGKSCIITGGGGGIGRGIAARLAAEGASVCVADIDTESAGQVADEISSAGGVASACGVDVAERDSVKAMVSAAVESFGRLDVIFNNAGLSNIRPFMELTEDDWNSMMRVNALGVLICMQEAARRMIEQNEGGKIINTSSISGRQAREINAHYAASKFSVVALTQSGARALAAHGITVNAFCPGVVETAIWERLDRELVEWGVYGEAGDSLKEVTKRIVLGRTSTPDDVVGLAAFLASGDSDYITGQSIMVDGGMLFM